MVFWTKFWLLYLGQWQRRRRRVLPVLVDPVRRAGPALPLRQRRRRGRRLPPLRGGQLGAVHRQVPQAADGRHDAGQPQVSDSAVRVKNQA